ncbi:MAG: hypothetical protein U0237_00795 [Thermoleophilia bacterium]
MSSNFARAHLCQVASRRIRIAAAFAACGALATPGVASASTLASTTALRGCTYAAAPPESGLNAGLCAPLQQLAPGLGVTMLCWKDDYGRRWFLVKTATGFEGYVEGSAVANQVMVNHCAQAGTVTRKVLAADWAFLTVGQRYGGADISTFYPAASWRPGPVGEFSGDCIKLAHYAWFRGTGVSSYLGNAIDVWAFYASRGLVGPASQPPPYGSMIFYGTAVDPRGHVGIAVGGTRIVNTKGVDGQALPVAWQDYREIPGYLGWVPIENLRAG